MIAAAARKIATTCTVLCFATIGTAAAPKPANAYGWGVGVYVPPVVVAPPPGYYPSPASPAYYPAPAYYAPPSRVWIPAHGQGNYWVPGHWS